jgi:hypothetical protein
LPMKVKELSEKGTREDDQAVRYFLEVGRAALAHSLTLRDFLKIYRSAAVHLPQTWNETR